MLSLIEAMFGITLPKWAIELIVAGLAIGAVLLYFKHEVDVKTNAELAKVSVQATAQAAAQIKANDTAHAVSDAANQEKLDAAQRENGTVSAQRDAIASAYALWVRQHAGSGSHTAVAGTGGQPGAADTGECGSQSCADLTVQLVNDGNALARDLGAVVADMQSCQRDRDALTGMPK